MKLNLKAHQLILTSVLIIVVLYFFVDHYYDPPRKSDKNVYGNIKELFGLLSTISITAGVISLIFLQRGNDYNVVSGCMARYSALMPDLIRIETEIENTEEGNTEEERKAIQERENKWSIERESILRRYFDLSNEELFYIKNRLVPAEIELAWTEGITRQLINLKRKDAGYLELIDEQLQSHLYQLKNQLL